MGKRTRGEARLTLDQVFASFEVVHLDAGLACDSASSSLSDGQRRCRILALGGLRQGADSALLPRLGCLLGNWVR